MEYHISKQLELSFDEALAYAKVKLKETGFGVLTEIDMKATMKKKLDKELSDYVILGACHAPSAYEAVSVEPRIGLMLPCNVIVRTMTSGVEVSAVSPKASMMAIQNEGLKEIAESVEQKLQDFISSL